MSEEKDSGKFCVRCAHYSLKASYIWVHACARAARMQTDPVTGQASTVGLVSCSSQRASEDSKDCGPEGRFFKPANSKD